MKGICRFCSRSVLHRFIEAGCSRKAPFVIRTKDQWEMFQKSSCTSLSVRVIQREFTFQKGSVNSVLRQNSLSLPKTDNPQPSTSSQIQPSQESAKSNNNESESGKKGNFPKTHQRQKELLLQTVITG